MLKIFPTSFYSFMKKFSTPIYGYLFFGLSLFYSFVLVFYGIDFTDTFYHLNSFKDFELSSLTGLTSLIGIFWMKLFGNNLLSFRILNLLLINFAVIIPFLFFVPKAEKTKSYIFLGSSIVLLASLNANIFNYDTVTLFFLSFASIWIIKYYQTGKKSYLLTYGFFSALLILARFPNIVILPLSIILLLIIEYQKYKKVKKDFLIKFGKVIFLYFFICTIVLVLASFLMYGNINGLFPRVSNSISSIGKHHSLKTMIWRYSSHFVQIFQYIAVIALLVYFGVKERNFPKKYKYFIHFLIYILISLFLMLGIKIIDYNLNLSLFYSALCYALIINYLCFYFKRHENDFITFPLILFGFSIIPSMGSNTGLLKTSLFLLCYFPFLFLFIKRNRLLYHKIIYKMIFLLVVFSVYTRITNIYEDSSLNNLNCELKYKLIRYIHTTKERCYFIEEVLSDILIEKNKNHPILLYGRVSHIFYYLTNITPLYQHSFWMPFDESSEISRVEEVIKKIKPVIFLLSNYPENNDQNYIINQISKNQFNNVLLTYDYKISERNGYKVYYPK